MIPFNKPPVVGGEEQYLREVLSGSKHCGDGPFTKKVSDWFETNYGVAKALLTTSCTHALEMAALLSGVGMGDEVILPSYTFVSTANAFALRGATLVFCDVDPHTMNLDLDCLENAISPRTKVICIVHYAGLSCDMNKLLEIVHEHDLILVEDAAQAIESKFEGRQLGTFGHFGCFSFHETKNLSCGEGGLLVVNAPNGPIEQAEIVREKGTNRSKFWRGQVDKYTWMDLGSSYLPSEFNAAILLAQLENIDRIQKRRNELWTRYHQSLSHLVLGTVRSAMSIPDGVTHNAHMFWLKLKDIEERSEFIETMRRNGILTVFHYVPLHSSPAGLRFGKFSGTDDFTTRESNRLVRLPLYFNMQDDEQEAVISAVSHFLEILKP